MYLGWQIYVKANADKIRIIDYKHQLGFCYITLEQLDYNFPVLQLY